MKQIKTCYKISNIAAALIYITALPFLMLFFLHVTIPSFEIAHSTLNGLFFVANGFVFIKICMAIITKYKLCKYEKKIGKKLNSHRIIHFL